MLLVKSTVIEYNGVLGSGIDKFGYTFSNRHWSCVMTTLTRLSPGSGSVRHHDYNNLGQARSFCHCNGQCGPLGEILRFELLGVSRGVEARDTGSRLDHNSIFLHPNVCSIRP